MKQINPWLPPSAVLMMMMMMMMKLQCQQLSDNCCVTTPHNSQVLSFTFPRAWLAWRSFTLTSSGRDEGEITGENIWSKVDKNYFSALRCSSALSSWCWVRAMKELVSLRRMLSCRRNMTISSSWWTASSGTVRRVREGCTGEVSPKPSPLYSSNIHQPPPRLHEDEETQDPECLQ